MNRSQHSSYVSQGGFVFPIAAPLSLSAELRHFALITHQVPASRVRRLVPRCLELDLVDGRALVSIGCFYTREFGLRFAPARFPRLNFEQVTWRTYVRYRGRRGVFFFRTALGTVSSFLLQRAAARSARPAAIRTCREPYAQHFVTKLGYDNYEAEVISPRLRTSFKLEATHKAQSDHERELDQFLTFRPHGFFHSSLGVVMDQAVAHRPFDPWKGRLIQGRFDYWQKLNILYPDEAQEPVSVLVEPAVRFVFYPPMPRLLVPPTRTRRLPPPPSLPRQAA